MKKDRYENRFERRILPRKTPVQPLHGDMADGVRLLDDAMDGARESRKKHRAVVETYDLDIPRNPDVHFAQAFENRVQIVIMHAENRRRGVGKLKHHLQPVAYGA